MLCVRFRSRLVLSQQEIIWYSPLSLTELEYRILYTRTVNREGLNLDLMTREKEKKQE